MIFPEDLENWFTYHACEPDQVPRFQEIREAAKHLAQVMVRCCPDAKDTRYAVLRVREAVMMANAAIACESREESLGAA